MSAASSIARPSPRWLASAAAIGAWTLAACSPASDEGLAPKASSDAKHDAAVDAMGAQDMPVPTPSHDAAPFTDDAPAAANDDAASPDAGPRPYVRTDGGPFGLPARTAKQTCLAPARYDQPAATLRATGCVDAQDPTKPAAGLLPYQVNSPLWSDGADKQRFIALPDGALIHVKDCKAEPDTCKPKSEGGTTDDEGHFEMPVGTVLVKSFLFGGRLVETRLFVRFSDMWAGYSYQWNEAQTDAALVDESGLTQNITNASGKMQSWYFPKRNDCLECHNDTVGGALGLESIQLDRTVDYGGGVMASQLASLEHIGVFDAPVTRLAPLVDPRITSGATSETRARSYLHANCAICHRPEGNYSSIDMRDGTPLAQMNVCNVDPNKGDLGVAGAKRLFPGTPSKSVMVLRMQATDMKSGRMPQIATSVLDTTGIGIVSDWIKSVTTCP
jgi:uncharacterized repeat protein (TIGR03806 family)